MIRVNDIPLVMPTEDVSGAFPIDLASLLFAPQSVLPDGAGGTFPPAQPPYRLEYAPGTLYWPQGASRFAVGQYLVTDLEAQSIREIVLEDPITNHLTLTLGGEGTGQDEVTFQMHLLHLIPLQLDRAATPIGVGGFYLMILVDYRYFFQTLAPDWAIDDTTTWDDLDALLLTFLPAGSAADAVDSDYLQPGTALAPPQLATDGVVGWAGPLLDAICLASGRRFVANPDGTFTLQGLSAARSAHLASREANAEYMRYGGRLAFPPESEETQGLVLVPNSLLFVFPEESGGTTEVAPYTKQVTFTSVKTAAGLTDDVPIREGELLVATSLWSDNANTADLDAWAERWATDWYGFLSAGSVRHYSGAVDFPPDGMTDCTVWRVTGEDVWTRVYRGVLNPRPALVLGYSGVDPPTPAAPGAVYLYNTVAAPTVATLFDTIRALNATGVQFDATTGNEFDLKLLAAGASQMGAVTTGIQSFAGVKTFLQALHAQQQIIFDSSSPVPQNEYIHWQAIPEDVGGTPVGSQAFLGPLVSALISTSAYAYECQHVCQTPSAENRQAGWGFYQGDWYVWRYWPDGTPATRQMIRTRWSDWAVILGDPTDEDGPLRFHTDDVEINGTAGFTGTGGGGDTFLHGWCTAAGAGGGGITTIVIPGPTSITGTSVEFIAGSGMSITSPGAGQITFASTITTGTQSANTVFAGPASGAAAAPTFRALVADDIAANLLPLSKMAQGTALSVVGVAGNAAANYADIVAGADANCLRRSGTTLGFGVLTAPGGGTGHFGYDVGDVLYASTTSALSKLTAGARGRYLSMGASSVPAWLGARGEILGDLLVLADESTTSNSYVALTTADSIAFTTYETANIVCLYFAMAYTNTNGGACFSQLFDGPGALAAYTVPQFFTTANFAGVQYLAGYQASVAAGTYTWNIKHSNNAGAAVAHWFNRYFVILRDS